MTMVYDVEDLMQWLEPIAGALFWRSDKTKDQLANKPPEFRRGGYAYLHSQWPKGRRKRGLAANEFWFRGQVLDGERVLQLVEMLK